MIHREYIIVITELELREQQRKLNGIIFYEKRCGRDRKGGQVNIKINHYFV